MLCITRTVERAVYLDLPDGGGRIVVKVLEHRPNGQVRLGIEAPAAVRIRRDDAVVTEPADSGLRALRAIGRARGKVVGRER